MNKAKLQRNRQVLVENGEFNNLKDWLIHDGILTPVDVEIINAARRRGDRMRELVNIILRNPEEDVGKFFTSLERADPDLFSQLVGPSSGAYQIVEDSSTQPVSSGVPKGSRGEERKRTEEKEDEEKERREKEDEEKGRKLHCGIAHMLNCQITDNYLKDMKVLSSPYLEPAILCNCTSPSDIFEKLETKGHIRIGNYKTLKDVLEQAGLVNVLKKVEEKEKDILPYTKPATPWEFEIVQTELKAWYLDSMRRIRPLPMCEWDEQDLEHIFTNLQMVQGRKRRNSGSVKEQSSDGPEINDRIFKVTPSERNICFIEGPAGIGKSTLCRQFAFLWSKDGCEIHGHHFDLVGILEARSLTKDFRKSLVQELFPEDYQISNEQIYEHFQTRKSLLIIDGVDELTADGEWAITQLLKGRFFRDVHLIITGRSESVRKFLRPTKLHLKVTGFSVRNAEEYICKYFRNDENSHKKKLLHRLRHGRELSELMVNPFVTVLLCILVREKSGEIPSNVSEIYREVIYTIFRKYVRKLQEQGDCPLDDVMLFNAACDVAYSGLTKEEFTFAENDINSLCEGNLGVHLLKSGILSKDYTISRLNPSGFCYFPHRSFQEFLCGFYLEKMDLEEFKQEVLPLLPNSPALPFNHPILACLRYLLSTQANKVKIVLDYLFEIVAQDKTNSLIYLYFWIFETVDALSSYLVDLVDVLRIHCNRSFKVALVLCEGSASEDCREIFDHKDHVQLAICKMDFPPVTYIRDVEADFRVNAYNESEWEPLILANTLLLNFRKSNGLKMPFIHCDDIRDASACLQKLSRLGVLAITVTPYSLNDVVDLQAFQQDLTSVENKINIVFVFLEDRYDDSRFLNFISLMKGYSSDKVKIQVITLKPVDMPYWEHPYYGFSLDNSLDLTDWCVIVRTKYELPQRLHWECYNRFCPY